MSDDSSDMISHDIDDNVGDDGFDQNEKLIVTPRQARRWKSRRFRFRIFRFGGRRRSFKPFWRKHRRYRRCF